MNTTIYKKQLLTNTIIEQAISLGFDFEDLPNRYDLETELFEFFIQNTEELTQDHVEVEVECTNGKQSVSHGEFYIDGDIIHRNKHQAGDKVYHTEYLRLIYGEVNLVRLYTII